MSDRYTYSVDDDNVIRLFDANAQDPSVPFLYQPFNPQNILPFESRQAAEDFAKAKIAEIIYADNNPRPRVEEEPTEE